MITCPHCLKSFDPDADPVELKRRELQAKCQELGIPVTWDGYVSEAAAADCLGRRPATLRGWRDQQQPIPFRKVGGRVQYALCDLASHLVGPIRQAA